MLTVSVYICFWMEATAVSVYSESSGLINHQIIYEAITIHCIHTFKINTYLQYYSLSICISH